MLRQLLNAERRVPSIPGSVAPRPLSIVVVILFLFSASSFTAATLTHFIGGNAGIAQLITLTVPTLFVTVIFLSFWWQHVLLRAAGRVTAVAMGFLNFAFLAALACWPIDWATSVAGVLLHRPSIAWTLLGFSALVALYGLVNAATLRVTRYTIHLQNLPRSWQGRNVALVSDIHVGVIWGQRFVRQIVTRLKELEPTAVFISGDMFDGAKVDIVRSVEPWSEFRAPAGTYFVTGNHDEFSNPAPYLAALTNAGIRVLHNEKVVVDGLQIAGINDAETHCPALYRKLLNQAQIDPVQPSILLAHRPKDCAAALLRPADQLIDNRLRRILIATQV